MSSVEEIQITKDFLNSCGSEFALFMVTAHIQRPIMILTLIG